MFSSNCCFLTCIQISQEAGKLFCYTHLFKIFPQFVVIQTVKGFSVINEAEVDFFFFWNSFAFSVMQQMLAIWSLTLLPFLNPTCTSGSCHFMYCWSIAWRFDIYLASRWNECNSVVVWTFFDIGFFEIGIKTDLFQSCGHCQVFPICWDIECSTLTTSSFMILKSSAGISCFLLS